MQIISELEGYRRGPYAGAVGYRFPDGSLDTCIAIRTIVLADGVALPPGRRGHRRRLRRRTAEHEECLRKLAALETALNLAEADGRESCSSTTTTASPTTSRTCSRSWARRSSCSRNDEIDADEAEQLAPTHLVISPGPGPARGLGRDARRSSAGSRRRRRRSASASATRRSSRRSAARSARPSGSSTGRRAAIHARRARHLRRAPAGLLAPAATTRSPQTRYRTSSRCRRRARTAR